MEVSKGLDQIPLYVKAETLLPVAEPQSHIGRDTVFLIHMRAYGSNPGGFTLYADDGETYDFEKGDQTRLVLSWGASGGTATRSGRFARHRYEILDWTPVQGASLKKRWRGLLRRNLANKPTDSDASH